MPLKLAVLAGLAALALWAAVLYPYLVPRLRLRDDDPYAVPWWA